MNKTTASTPSNGPTGLAAGSLVRVLTVLIVLLIALLSHALTFGKIPVPDWLSPIWMSLTNFVVDADTQWQLLVCMWAYLFGFVCLIWKITRDRERAVDGMLLLILTALGLWHYMTNYPAAILRLEFLVFVSACLCCQSLELARVLEEERCRNYSSISHLFPVCFAFIIAILAVIQPNSNTFVYHGYARWSGVWPTPNVYGLLMASGVIISYYHLSSCLLTLSESRNKPLNHLVSLTFSTALLTTSLGLIMSFSRGAWLGCGLGLLYVFCKQFATQGTKTLLRLYSPCVAIIIVSLFIVGLWTMRHSQAPLLRRIYTPFNINDTSWRNRTAVMPSAFAAITERPFVGHGWTALRIYENVYKPPWLIEGSAVSQNNYLLLALMLGLPGMCIFFFWIVRAYSTAVPKRFDLGTKSGKSTLVARAAAIPLLVGLAVDGPLFDTAIAIPLFGLLQIARDRSASGPRLHDVSVCVDQIEPHHVSHPDPGLKSDLTNFARSLRHPDLVQ